MARFPRFIVLECTGHWIPTDSRSSREVIVQFGNESITILTGDESIISHWTLNSIHEVPARGKFARFTPDPAAGECLEISDELMINALRNQMPDDNQPYGERASSGGIPFTKILAILLVLLGTLYFAAEYVTGRAANFIVGADRIEIGESLFNELISGRNTECFSRNGASALDLLQNRISSDLRSKIRVVTGGIETSILLPGGTVLLNASLLDGFDGPELVAGYVLLAKERNEARDSLEFFLTEIGWIPTLYLLLGLEIEPDLYRSHAELLAGESDIGVDAKLLLDRILAAGFPARPLGQYAKGEGFENAVLVEDTTFDNKAYWPLLSDEAWLDLRNICRI